LKPAQKRTRSASPSSQDNQDVIPGCRVAAQLDSGMLLPPLTPETSAAPGAGRAVRPRGCPGQARGAQVRGGRPISHGSKDGVS
jgi:hypothetical protein